MKPIRLSGHTKDQLISEVPLKRTQLKQEEHHNGKLRSWEGGSVEKILSLKMNGIRSILRLNR
ncbi:MAG: hypothetical protein HZA13_03930 [Nitrospirae bacterium]|nr:hypothetical protein [Nitrospirota bacterium]